MLTHTVIGEIMSEKPDEIIVVGGHLDHGSRRWCHDDGAGIVQSMEVLKF